jgi:hypothetical protein
MTSMHYCVTALHLSGFRTYGFDSPVDLVQFLAQPPTRIIHIVRLFEIPYQHPVYCGIVSSI